MRSIRAILLVPQYIRVFLQKIKSVQNIVLTFPKFLDLLFDNMSGTVNNILTNRNRDCIACRLISGAGLIGAGIYVSHHRKKFNKTIGKSIMFSIACGLMALGSARILNLPPFQDQFG
ncbi:uncharacterized protein LOC107264959 [Cephus cinctus]|uniref:Uncharacterized protein LOC107264959 n=1 Tax=Cephus cinctus TaxID=211228 RepID=A0AAJ7BMQ1_CEPCN|nr:uncharacterized protein LOC107264959 [Cephus cinctus]